MGTAIRDTAENLHATTDEKVEQRRRNAADAKEYRAALVEGRVLVSVPVDNILTDDLPRDRIELDAVASSDEMVELKTSIAAHGQREPIEVFRDESGSYQLKSGWRRLNALRQLYEETGEAGFATVKARISEGEQDRLSMYIDMAEENIIREDLTFAEMAQLAITAANDPEFQGASPDAIVGDLYKSVHKVKRSYIRSFVLLLATLGSSLKWPKDVARNLGVDVARVLKSDTTLADPLCKSLASSNGPEDQNKRLQDFVVRATKPKPALAKSKPKEKFEFHLDDAKVTARYGECRIVSPVDFTKVPRDRLERAIIAFRNALED